MTTETIDREAGDSGKGFRLQLIRAIKLMLKTIQQDVNTVFFTAVENLEDVSHQTIVDGEVSNYFEEDKNYDLSGNFSNRPGNPYTTPSPSLTHFKILRQQFHQSSLRFSFG